MIPSTIQTLLEPLERYEEIRRRVVRLGDRLCDLSYANPYEGLGATTRAVLKGALSDERTLDLQYSPFGGRTLSRRAVAESLNTSHGLPFTYTDVVLTPGAMAALQVALRVAGSEGSEVVIPVPCWLDYPVYVHHVGLEPVLVPLAAPGFDIDVGAIEQAITERTCAVLLAHPANPTGRSYGADTLRRVSLAVARKAERLGTRVTVIADETHRDFVGDQHYASFASHFNRCLVVYSFGKYHFMQGQRLGYVAVSPNHPERSTVSEELVRWMRITGLATPTALMQKALVDLVTLKHDVDWLFQWRARVVDRLSAAGYNVVEPDATLFVYVQTPNDIDDFEFVRRLAISGVLALPAPVFHHRGYFRLALTASESMLRRALPLLEKARAA
jgi:aspartate aminotransferase